MRRLCGRLLLVLGLVAGCATEESVVSDEAAPLEGTNGIGTNGLSTNGIWQNGIWQNGIWQNGIWQNGIWQNSLSATELLQTNPYAAQLLQYVYACAMPPGTQTTLDPFAGTKSCSTGADCGVGFACSAQQTCVIPLQGSIGVGVNTDGVSTWAEQGYCDETCQRWVSACVLARTNAYGVKVDISLRAPEGAPQKIRDALAVTDDERAAFPLREGSYYGNLFATTPLNPAPDASIAVNTPSFFACGGPGSNIPQITKRFCSSRGDDGPIQAVGLCETEGSELGACAGVDATSGAAYDCHTTTDPALQTPQTMYREVLTVYLKEPIAVCGDAICEASEATSCPSDCTPGTWARALPGMTTPVTAVTPSGGTAVFGHVADFVTVDDGISLMVGPETAGQWAVAFYTADGSYVDTTFGNAFMGGLGTELRQFVVRSDGTMIFLNDRRSGFVSRGFDLYRTTAEFGVADEDWWGWMIDNDSRAAITLDRTEHLIVAGRRTGPLEGYFKDNQDPDTLLADAGSGGYVLKLDGVTGAVLWTTALAVPDAVTPVVDAANRVLVVSNEAAAPSIIALDGATGAVLWTHAMPAGVARIGGITTDPAGNLYATGALSGAVDFGNNVRLSPASAQASFLLKLDPTRQAVWARGAETSAGTAIGFDTAGYVTVAGRFTQPLDLGSGLFLPYATPDAYIASYAAADGAHVWSRHVPFILDGSLNPLVIAPNGNAVTSGVFAGSMMIDNRFLVTDAPATSRTNTYVASFGRPCTAAGCDTTPPVMDHVPESIVLEATSRAGAEGWYMVPTAIDGGARGTNVACTPAPNTMFPIGTTTVTCTASDPIGNRSTVTFPLTVRDTLPPVMTNVPAGGIAKTSTSAAGAVATFAPVAVDQIDGARPVTCAPASGSTFPVGTTQVSCSAADLSGNVTTVGFAVTVGAPSLSWSGILQPINVDGSSVFKRGRVVPVKFRLTGSSAGITDLVAKLTLAKLSNAVTGTDVEAVAAGSANTGNVFRYDAVEGVYIYNLDTSPLTTGTWQLKIDFGDGVARSAVISLSR